MTDQDKVLINAYFDGETTAKETHAVTELLQKDDEARSYLESLKGVNVQMDVFEQSSEIATLKKWTTKYANEHVKDKPTLLDHITGFVESSIFKHAVGYSLSAAFFVTVGINLPTTNLDSGTLDDFNTLETLEIRYPKMRNAGSDTEKDKILRTVEAMFAEKTLNARIIWGGDTYFVTIASKNLAEDGLTCYQGEFTKAGINKKFLYCDGSNDKSITYIN